MREQFFSRFPCIQLLLRTSSLLPLVTRTDGKLFSLDEDIVSSLEEKYGFSAYTIKAGSYEGQDEE